MVFKRLFKREDKNRFTIYFEYDLKKLSLRYFFKSYNIKYADYIYLFDMSRSFIHPDFIEHLEGEDMDAKMRNISLMFMNKNIYANTILFVNKKFNYKLTDTKMYPNGKKLKVMGYIKNTDL